MANTMNLFEPMNESVLSAVKIEVNMDEEGPTEQLFQSPQTESGGDVKDNMPGDDLVFIFDWPPNSSYDYVTATCVPPKVDIVSINDYFLEVYRDNMGITKYVTIHRKGYNMMLNNYLTSLLICTQEHFTFFKGRVHSEHTEELNYFATVAFNADGKIIRSICECPAGKKPRAICKHTACICYTILRYKEHSEWLITKTAVEEWYETKNFKVISDAKKAEIQAVIQDYYDTEYKSRILCYDPRPANTCTHHQWNDFVRNSVINYCSIEKMQFSINTVINVASVNGIANDHDYVRNPNCTVTSEEDTDEEYLMDHPIKQE